MGLAGVGGDQVFDLLYAATARGDLRERRAAVIGLSELRNTKVGPALLRIAVAHYPEELGKFALFGLTEKGGARLRSEIHTLMRADIKPRLRREFLFLLGEMQDQTAFRPLLLELKAGRAANRACRLLTAITGLDLCQDAERVAKYEAWHEAEYGKGQSSWFLAALQSEGLKSSLTTTHLIAGATPAVIEELCRVLESAKTWPVRALASHFLRDLTRTDHGTAGPSSSLGAVQAMAERYRSFAREKHASGR